MTDPYTPGILVRATESARQTFPRSNYDYGIVLSSLSHPLVQVLPLGVPGRPGRGRSPGSPRITATSYSRTFWVPAPPTDTKADVGLSDAQWEVLAARHPAVARFLNQQPTMPTTRLPDRVPEVTYRGLTAAEFEALLCRIEDVLVAAIDSQEYEHDRDYLLDQREYLRTQKLPHYGIHDYETVYKLERHLLLEDHGPDHASYLIDLVEGYGAWGAGAVGRIRAVQTALAARPWQRAFALAKCLDPKLDLK